ncbi:hypothetical protein JCGZ_22551 [Jatropha curcas]|uniref:Uncharacterized protein n=1 Tax=Jatropha curcas TaxID=180498 RepID=A0A067K203_JATCU|nr:hypothetical protein JCGZ_22551 [Jatropha curcas]
MAQNSLETDLFSLLFPLFFFPPRQRTVARLSAWVEEIEPEYFNAAATRLSANPIDAGEDTPRGDHRSTPHFQGSLSLPLNLATGLNGRKRHGRLWQSHCRVDFSATVDGGCGDFLARAGDTPAKPQETD